MKNEEEDSLVGFTAPLTGWIKEGIYIALKREWGQD